uniref:Uncharacterized protein n=1 Tax=Rhizophora mucronata TaxID=61149 RepID=A0A2P2P7Y9_RHIMU
MGSSRTQFRRINQPHPSKTPHQSSHKTCTKMH